MGTLHQIFSLYDLPGYVYELASPEFPCDERMEHCRGDMTIHRDCSLAMPARCRGVGVLSTEIEKVCMVGVLLEKKGAVAAELIKDKFLAQQEALHQDSDDVEIPACADRQICRSCCKVTMND